MPELTLLQACKEGLRLAEIAVRQGLVNMPKTQKDEIVKSHHLLVAIRAAIAKAESEGQK